MPSISKLVGSFEESATLALGAKAKKLAAEGRSIVNFGVGEPDFVTPEVLIEKAYHAAKSGQTKYTAVSGLPSVRKAIAERISKDYGVSYSADEVIVSAGGKQAIYHFLQSTLNPNDEVIIFSPYWVSFPEMVKLCGGKPVIVNANPKIDIAKVKAALNSKTKAIILNSPSNPSGQVYSRSELEALAGVLKSREIWILSDDTYYTLTYTSEPWTSILQVEPELKSQTCIVNSSSKTYAMTGWRLGWALGPKPLIDAMTKLQSQVSSNASSLSQAAVEWAVGPEHDRISKDHHQKFASRRDVMISELSKISGLTWMPPDGAFYVFIRVGPLLKTESATQFAGRLLEEFGVCAIPGEAFGEPEYLRLSYALSEAQIREGVLRLQKALKAS